MTGTLARIASNSVLAANLREFGDLLEQQGADGFRIAAYRRAHELGRVGEWVVIYYQTDALPEGQCTIVTESRGPLAGRRVVRGREAAALRPATAPARRTRFSSRATLEQ